MTIEALNTIIQTEVQKFGFVDFPPEVWAAITPELAAKLAEQHQSSVFVRLPQPEIEFFEWLRYHDTEIWRDLWEVTPEEAVLPEELQAVSYLVGIGLISELVVPGRGFPICDLIQNPNYYFSIKNLRAEEAKPFIDAALAHIDNNQPLSPAECFLLELRRASIDIWRFAYLYHISPDNAKRVALQLAQDGLLDYAPGRDDVSQYL